MVDDLDCFKEIVGLALEIGRARGFSAAQLYDLEIIAALSMSGESIDVIRDTFGDFVAETVRLLKRGGANYFDYVSRLIDSGSKYAMYTELAKIKFVIPNLFDGEKSERLFAERMIYSRLN